MTKVKDDNYTAVILEDIRDQVKILAEGQIGIRNNVETLTTDMSVLKSDVSTLKSDVSTLKSDLAEFKDDTKQNFKIIDLSGN